MTRCPVCDGLLRLEPAALTCVFCGRFVAIHAEDEALWAQYVLDWTLRPHSVECSERHQVPPTTWRDMAV
jgi:hypothetical protein